MRWLLRQRCLTTMFDAEIEQIVARLAAHTVADKRVMIAIAGPPAAGKSTLAELLVERLNAEQPGSAALVPMDGFHLDNDTLDARELRARKGAPNTFDADGFVALVETLAKATEAVTYPTFDRSLDASIADSGTVKADTRIIVLEGNYLLLNETPWSALHPLFDLTIFVRPNVTVLEQRLLARWKHYGLDEAQAQAKASGNDIPNAHTVLENSVAADMVFAEPD